MRKKHIKNNFEGVVMQKILSGEVKMKPRIFFIIGSILMFASIVGLIIASVFLMAVTFFLLRSHGVGSQWRLKQMIESFPLWIPAFGMIGTILGVLFLRKYDFSYKKNFVLIVIGFIASILVSAWVIDKSGLNDIWLKRGPMRRFYQQWKYNNDAFERGRGNRYFRQNR